MNVDQLVAAQSRKAMTESGHQVCLFRWAGLAAATMPELRWLHSIPNGGYRAKRTAATMKAEGQKPGVPDIFLDVPRKGFHGLRIELKVPRVAGIKGVSKTKRAGTTSDDQDEWIAHYAANGYAVYIAYGWTEAMDFIKEYLS